MLKRKKNAWPGNRVVKCAMRYKFGRKIIGNESRFRECERSRTIDGTRTTGVSFAIGFRIVTEKDSCVKNRLGCRNLRRHSQLQTWWTHIFFFSLSPHLFSFLLVALALPCSKPVGLSPCACKWIIYHLCLSRPVLNKTHDREIALWNARMRIYFDAKWENWEKPR